MEKIIGIKGFDKDLKCSSFQYEIGKEYYSPKKPRLCSEGFHFCQTLNDVFCFYPNKDGNRYCIVEATGDIDYGFDKSATNRIKIIRELTWKELDNSEPKISTELLIKLSNKGFVIGGSMALKLYGYNIKRTIKEVDLIIFNADYESKKEEINNIINGMKSINRNSGMDSIDCKVGLFGEKYDIITQKNKINYVERNVNGIKLKLQDENQIWQEKLKYALNGSMKHAKDILDFGITFIKEPKITQPNEHDSLPF